MPLFVNSQRLFVALAIFRVGDNFGNRHCFRIRSGDFYSHRASCTMYRSAECNSYGNPATMLLYFTDSGLHGAPGTADIIKQDNVLTCYLVLIHEEPRCASLLVVMVG